MNLKLGSKVSVELPEADRLSKGVLLYLTLFPCVIMCYGLYVAKSSYVTMGLYHALVLIPGIYLGRRFWLKDVKMPTMKQWLWVMFGTVAFNSLTIFLYEHIGYLFIDNQRVWKLISNLGFVKQHLIVLSLYFVFVNASFEELFWRGVILNKLESMPWRWKHFGLVASSLMYGAFHYFILRIVVYPGWAEVGFVELSIWGAFMAIVYKRTHNIVLSCLTHAFLTDLAAMLLMLDMCQRY